jgi:hypothetical protein
MNISLKTRWKVLVTIYYFTLSCVVLQIEFNKKQEPFELKHISKVIGM